MPREENGQANALAQQASGYSVGKGKFNIRRPMRIKAELLVLYELVRSVAATGLTAQSAKTTDSVKKKVEDPDWIVPIISYLKHPGRGAERNIQRAVFKYILIDDDLYRRTAEDLLLKCLDSDQAKVATGEVHEGICGTHQSAPKMKWLLGRARFYWPSMISDCFRVHMMRYNNSCRT